MYDPNWLPREATVRNAVALKYGNVALRLDKDPRCPDPNCKSDAFLAICQDSMVLSGIGVCECCCQGCRRNFFMTTVQGGGYLAFRTAYQDRAWPQQFMQQPLFLAPASTEAVAA